MLAIARAYKERSLQDFQTALKSHEAELVGDPIVHAHLSALYDTLLEGNLARLIEPFSRVEIAHLAELIQLPQPLVLNKLSQVPPAAAMMLSKMLPWAPSFRGPERNADFMRCARSNRMLEGLLAQQELQASRLLVASSQESGSMSIPTAPFMGRV